MSEMERIENLRQNLEDLYLRCRKLSIGIMPLGERLEAIQSFRDVGSRLKSLNEQAAKIAEIP